MAERPDFGGAGSDDKAPIIIKRVKKAAHGHHGGAWKVAYADFVTAMMAFFLLLWLLNAVTEQQLNGVADYFTPHCRLNPRKRRRRHVGRPDRRRRRVAITHGRNRSGCFATAVDWFGWIGNDRPE